MISGIKKVTIKIGTTYYYFNNINPQKSSYKKESRIIKDVSGGLNKMGDKATLIIAAYDDGNYQALRAEMIAKTDITLVQVQGIEEHIYWKEPTTFVITQTTIAKPGKRNYNIIKFTYNSNNTNLIYTTTTLEKKT